MNMVRNYSPRRPRLERKRVERAERIVETALRLVVEEGLEALTIQRLARKMDRAVGTLYRYFPSKEALLAELQRQAIASFQDDLRAELGRIRGTLAAGRAASLALLLVPARLYFTLPERRPVHFRLISLMVGDPRDLLPAAEAAPNVRWMLGLVAEILELFAAAVGCGAIEEGNALRRALLLWGGLQGTLELRKLGRFEPEPFHPEALLADLARTLLRGWGARPDEIDAALEMLETNRKE
jgi:AcrR family transcriptional regulator